MRQVKRGKGWLWTHGEPKDYNEFLLLLRPASFELRAAETVTERKWHRERRGPRVRGVALEEPWKCERERELMKDAALQLAGVQLTHSHTLTPVWTVGLNGRCVRSDTRRPSGLALMRLGGVWLASAGRAGDDGGEERRREGTCCE